MPSFVTALLHILFPWRPCRRYRRHRLFAVCCFLLSTLYLAYHISSNHNDNGTISQRGRRKQHLHGLLTTDHAQVCVHPDLNLHPVEYGSYFHELPPLKCDSEDNWVYVDNGTFRISKKARKLHGDIMCQYVPIFRGPDDYSPREGVPIRPMLDGMSLVSDFFTVGCLSSVGSRYYNVHSGITRKNIPDPLPTSASSNNNNYRYSVLMFGFDSLSRMSWLRTLPKLHDYFTNDLGGVLLEDYNIVGDGTPQALLPILTGKTENELPEARRGKPGAQTVDQFPWIWKDFHNMGYVTQWVEDMPHIGTFQYRMLGFKAQPTDHYMRPFYMIAQKFFPRFKDLCLGSLPRHINMLQWMFDLFTTYCNRPVFSFGFHSEASHEDNNRVRLLDTDVLNFLERLQNEGYLDRTIVFLMSDHGGRFNTFRSTHRGKLEERMPYFAIKLPKKFKVDYPHFAKNLETNAHRLTTPFDIHATFEHILNLNDQSNASIFSRGISLFKEIPRERSCAHAHIAPHWCACMTWLEVELTSSEVQQALKSVVNKINSLTLTNRNMCALLNLRQTIRAVRYSTNTEVLKFRKSADYDGRSADMTDNTKEDINLLQVTFSVVPGNGMFESTVLHYLHNNTYVVSDSDISRINKYGRDPHCIMDRIPSLRPYCFCRENMHGG